MRLDLICHILSIIGELGEKCTYLMHDDNVSFYEAFILTKFSSTNTVDQPLNPLELTSCDFFPFVIRKLPLQSIMNVKQNL